MLRPAGPRGKTFGRTIFSVRDVKEITGLASKSARNFADTLVQRGIATRLKAGLFILVPFELGREREYLGNPFLVAKGLAGGRHYFLSHASAMDLHGMLTQPQLVVYVTTSSAVRGSPHRWCTFPSSTACSAPCSAASVELGCRVEPQLHFAPMVVRYICPRCTANEHLKDWIQANGKTETCAFCGAEGQTACAEGG